MADHSLAGTRASLETLDSLRAPLESAKVALARASTAFCLSRRALFFLALGETSRGESSASRARLGARGGVEGACWPACLNLSSSALLRASFQSCLWLAKTSSRAEENVGKGLSSDHG